MEDKATELVQYHPGLTTTKQANSDIGRKETASDHIAIMTTTPDGIVFVSLNAAQSGKAGCGFAPESREHSDYIETPEQENERHQRLVDGLVNIAKVQKMDFLTLQEVSLSETNFCTMIIKSLVEYGYEVVKKEDDIANGWGLGQGIILYQSKKFELEVNSDLGINQFTHRGLLQGVRATFKINSQEGNRITVLSTHAAFKVTPELHENEIEKVFMAYGKDNSRVIILGDFNCPIAPFDLESKVIVTSVSAPLVHEENIQGAGFIDGAFYFDPVKSSEYYQLEIKHLNIKRGDIYTHSELAPFNVEQLPESQAKMVLQQRMINCTHYKYKTEKLIGANTIFEYQDFLRKVLNEKEILVRRSSNMFNVKGISIRLSRELYFVAQRVSPDLMFDKAVDFITKKPTDYFISSYNGAEIIKSMELVIEYIRLLTPEEKEFRAIVDKKIIELIGKFSQVNLNNGDDKIKEVLFQLRYEIKSDLKKPVSVFLQSAIDNLDIKKIDVEIKPLPKLNPITLENESPLKIVLTGMQELLLKSKEYEKGNDRTQKQQCSVQ